MQNHKTTITLRQATALHRVVKSMNNAGGSITVSHTDPLSPEEMEDLEFRLGWIADPPHEPEEAAITLDVEDDTREERKNVGRVRRNG